MGLVHRHALSIIGSLLGSITLTPTQTRTRRANSWRYRKLMMCVSCCHDHGFVLSVSSMHRVSRSSKTTRRELSTTSMVQPPSSLDSTPTPMRMHARLSAVVHLVSETSRIFPAHSAEQGREEVVEVRTSSSSCSDSLQGDISRSGKCLHKGEISNLPSGSLSWTRVRAPHGRSTLAPLFSAIPVRGLA